MATYNEIKGDTIEVRATDPANPVEGEIWYNSTTGTIKGYQTLPTAWSSGGNLNTARTGLAGFGAQTAAVGAGGGSPAPTIVGSVEEYNGSSWTTNPVSLINARFNAGSAGTQTAGLVFAGANPGATPKNLTEAYDGTSWTAGGTLGTARRNGAGCGTQTAALMVKGYSTVHTNLTEEYNGTIWTAGGTFPNTGEGNFALGTQTAALGGAGYTPGSGFLTNSAQYNGTSWTAAATVPARSRGEGQGTQTAGLIFAGSVPPVTGTTFTYDGSTYTATATMATARANLGGAGTQTAALGFGGTGPTAVTEEYNSGLIGTKTITTS